MPRQIDSEQRKREIAAALWRVIERQGMAAISVRSVAAEAGWSPGSVRYYFPSQPDLVRFAMELMLERVTTRIRTLWWQTIDAPDPIAATVAVLEEGLPLDAARATELHIWRAAHNLARAEPSLAEAALAEWQSARYLMRLIVVRLGLSAATPEFAAPLPVPAETEAALLQIFWDGLSQDATAFPAHYDPATIRHLLRTYLEQLRRRA